MWCGLGGGYMRVILSNEECAAIRLKYEDKSQQFSSVYGALTFAFNFSADQYAQSPMSKLVKGNGNLGSGKGLIGVDGAAQAGMIMREVCSLGYAEKMYLIALFTPTYEVKPSPDPEEVNDPIPMWLVWLLICSAPLHKWNPYYGLDVQHKVEQKRPINPKLEEALGVMVTHARLSYKPNEETLKPLLMLYFGHGGDLDDIAQEVGFHYNTVTKHNGAIKRCFDELHLRAFANISERLKGARIVA